MGDTFAAWIATMPDGRKNTIVCKAYALAQYIAKKRYPGYVELELVARAVDGEVVVIGDDHVERVG